MFRGYLRRGENISLKQIREPLRHTISNLDKISTISDKNINLRMHFWWSAPIVPQDTRLFEWRGCILSWHWEVLLNDLFYRSPGAKNSASDEQNIQLELGRGQICTKFKLNPSAFFGVRYNVMTVYADVRESISYIHLLELADLRWLCSKFIVVI